MIQQSGEVAAKEERVVGETAVGKEVEGHTETVRDAVRSTDANAEQAEPGARKRGKGSGR